MGFLYFIVCSSHKNLLLKPLFRQKQKKYLSSCAFLPSSPSLSSSAPPSSPPEPPPSPSAPVPVPSSKVSPSPPPNPWQPSSTVTFTVSGTLKEELSAGTIDTYATFDGIEVANKQDPICTYEGTPFSCPEAPGAKSWTFPFEIPSVPWSGTLSSKSTFKTGSGAELFCMELSVGL